MADPAQKLAVREKVGYAMGDIATNFFFQSMILYQTRFYTDTVGLSAVAVGTLAACAGVEMARRSAWRSRCWAGRRLFLRHFPWRSA